MEHCACLIRHTSLVSSPIDSTSQSIWSRNTWFPDPLDPDFNGPATSWQSHDGLGLGLVHTGPRPSGLDLHPLALLLETSTPLAGALFGLLWVLYALHPKLGAAHTALTKSA